jgi:hypothetical protein
MGPSKDEREALRGILGQAYHAKGNAAVGEQWQQEVMRRIRRLGALQSEPGFLASFQHVVWRLAPVAGVVLIVLTAVLVQVDFSPDYNVFQVLYNGTEELTLTQMLGI